MNTEKRKRLRELCDKATPGPWEPCGCRFSIVTAQITPQETMDICDTKINDAISCEQAEANNCFIAAARNALPELLDEVDRLEARVKELSNPATWRATINRLESAELEALAELDERIAENAALRERVEKLEKAGKQLRAAMTRPIADVVLIEKFKAAEEKWAAALDRAGEK